MGELVPLLLQIVTLFNEVFQSFAKTVDFFQCFPV